MQWRLRELREAAGLTQLDIANRIGTTPVSIGRYEREPGRVDLPMLEALAKVLNVPPTMLIASGTDGEHRHTVALHLRGGDAYMLFDRNLITTLGGAGKLAACEVSDDAMDPTLPIGSSVIVDLSQTRIERDGLYLLQVGGHEVVRRVFRQVNGALRVAGDNPVYRDGMTVQPDEITVTGRVVWGGRRF